ncbi:hypothetical protein, partial [Novosphingobium organovorum]|uniref:hypothetical protein n=1 Tax=Novosphingobium organovorum TaxID=2930092 RepID=UPI0038991453
MTSVEVIDRDPVERGAKVLFHLGHEVAGKALEVFEGWPVLGRDDQAELVPVLAAAFKEGFGVSVFGKGRVEPARLTIARGAVAFEVAHMRGDALDLTCGKLHDARLHRHPAGP